MSLDSSDELQKWFKQFWEYAEAQTVTGEMTSKPLLKVQINWKYWWLRQLQPSQRKEIEQIVERMSCAAQESFIKWVDDWIGERFERRGAGRLVLVQLAQHPLFESWASLKSYRPENLKEINASESLKGINAIILQSEDGGRPDDVKPLMVMLIPKEANEPDHVLPPVNMTDVANIAVGKSRRAVMSLLTGRGLLLLMLGSKARRWWDSLLLLGSCTLAWAIIFFIHIADSLPDSHLVPMLQTLIAVTPLLVLYVVWRNWRDLRLARKWARLLRQSQLCVLVGGVERGKRFDVDGPSFGVALCLGILLALHEEYPATAERSWPWWEFLKQLLEQLPNWVGTGEVTNWGRIKRVGRIEDKIEVCRNHSKTTHMIIPFQIKHLIAPLQKEAFPRGVRRDRPVTSSPTSVGQAAGEPKPRLHRCWHMAHVLIKIGGLINIPATVVNTALALLIVCIFFALPNFPGLMAPPADPKLITEKFGFGNIEPAHENDSLVLYFKTDDQRTDYSKHFVVRLKSRFWEDKEERLKKDWKTPQGELKVAFELFTPFKFYTSSLSLGKRIFDGEIEVIRYRRNFLFRQLPPVIIETVPLQHIRKKGWEAQGILVTLHSENSRSVTSQRTYQNGFGSSPELRTDQNGTHQKGFGWSPELQFEPDP